MTKIPMTVHGAEKIQLELDKLKKQDRPQVIKAIAEARAHGDLKENAEYHAAKEQQGFIEGRIRDIESRISHAVIIDITKMNNDGKVIFGATVSLEAIESDNKVTYQIVGEDEADLKHHKVSVTSPIARALIGKYVDDEIYVKTPEGEVGYEIIDVKYI